MSSLAQALMDHPDAAPAPMPSPREFVKKLLPTPAPTSAGMGRQTVESSSSNTPSSATNNGGGRSEMSFSGSRRKLQSNGFEERLAEALRKRLAPNTTLTVQRFAHLIGATERTVWSWLGGGGIRGKVLADMMAFFGAEFVSEVLDAPVLRPAREQRLHAIREELDRILEEGRD